MGKLDGRVAIVTGSGRGLGRGYAICMAKEGCSVVTNDIDNSAAEVAKEIRAAGGKAVPVIAGVGTAQTAQKLVEAAVKEFGTLHILVNNAGMTRDAMMVKMEEKQWDDVLTVHLKGTFLNTQAAVRYMRENGIKGRIINITSTAGIYGNIGQSNYCAAKAGIIGFTKAVSRELVKYGICVNSVAPGAKTSMTDAIPERIREETYQRLASTNTVQRVPMPEDVAPTVVFLASEESYFVSGQVIVVMGSVGSF